MSDTRFPWSRATELDVAYELKRRGDSLAARAMDCRGRCRVKQCLQHGRVREGEAVYVSTRNPGPSGGIVAHVDCVDRLCEKHTSSSANEARLKDAKAKGLLPLAAASIASMKAKQARASKNGGSGGSGNGLLKRIEELLQQAQDEAYAKGKEDGQAEVVALLEDLGDGGKFDARH